VLDLFRIPQGAIVGTASSLQLFIPRLVRKNYSWWNLSVVRDKDERSRRSMTAEAARIAV
jgi:hypothetical protein